MIRLHRTSKPTKPSAWVKTHFNSHCDSMVYGSIFMSWKSGSWCCRFRWNPPVIQLTVSHGMDCRGHDAVRSHKPRVTRGFPSEKSLMIHELSDRSDRTAFHGCVSNYHMGVSWTDSHRGTPSYHPFRTKWFFRYKPSSYWGTPMAMETARS